MSVIGIDHHTLNDLPICNYAGLAQSQHGPVILLFNGYAHAGQGRTIHSAIQIEAEGHDICDKYRMVGGKQRIKTIDGYTIPIQI